jgi:HK97 gp10 family phage protein
MGCARSGFSFGADRVKGGIDFDETKLRRESAKLTKRLNTYGENLLLDSQDYLKARMIALAPEGETHHLVNSIYVEVVKTSKGPMLRCGTRGVVYAVFVEFGTEDTPAQPFTRPAIAEMPSHIKQRARSRRP